jgi:hypothetical protein
MQQPYPALCFITGQKVETPTHQSAAMSCCFFTSLGEEVKGLSALLVNTLLLDTPA